MAENTPAATRHANLLADATKILEFVQAGKAIFTIKNSKTGNRATYRVEKETDKDGTRYAVAAFTGSDNTKKGSYTLMGVMAEDGTWVARNHLSELGDLEASALAKGDRWLIRFLKSVRRSYAQGWNLSAKQQKALTKNLKRHKTAGYVTNQVQLAAFPWLWNLLTTDKTIPESIEIWHEGCCARCARRLTVPASVETGFGYDCATVIGRVDEWKTLDRLLGRDLEVYAEKLAARHAA